MKIITSDSAGSNSKYVPPAIGNGDLSLQIDYQGMQLQKSYCGMTPNIRRAGFRHDTHKGELVPFGFFTQKIGDLDEPESWEQSLDPVYGLVESTCRYAGGTVIESAAFCHFTRNIVAIHKKITSDLSAPFVFKYSMSGKRIVTTIAGAEINYEIDGMREYSGTVSISSDVSFDVMWEDGEFSAVFKDDEFTIFLSFDESYDGSYVDLLDSNKKTWDEYWDEGYVDLPSEKIQRMYQVSQYHLRISSTKWSVPTGIFDSHWHGLYFAFDEYFNYMALATSGHLDTAGKIPHFRFNLLDVAKKRTDSKNHKTGTARYMWESNELGEECSSPGFWYDHIFHASNIALSAWEQYRFSGDMDLLRNEVYPVMRACCEWLRIFNVTRGADGSSIIGMCTDLERLGPARENPFMTVCSVIAAFSGLIEAAELLGVDADMLQVWSPLIGELRKNLPHNGERYVSYDGCPDISIGLLAGVYPYGVLDESDVYQQNAAEAYCADRNSCGNMYAMGSGICSWYACWEAMYKIRCGDGDSAMEILEHVAEESGCFGEMFEIYELGIRPWFVTSAAVYVQAVNEMLLQFKNNENRIAAAAPKLWKDYSFMLQGLSGKKVKVIVENGNIIKEEEM